MKNDPRPPMSGALLHTSPQDLARLLMYRTPAPHVHAEPTLEEKAKMDRAFEKATRP